MKIPHVGNFPRTQTVLAFGILIGCFVTQIEWRDALLMVLTFYFTKHDPNK